jgi:hypothetical protein
MRMDNTENTRSARIFIAFLNLIGFLAVIAANTLAVLLPLNNNTTQALSDKYPNLFVPAGLTFSIWGVIYILLGIYTVYQMIVAFRPTAQKRDFFDRIGIWFFISCVFNTGWIFAWHYEVMWLSFVIMLLLLISLLVIYLRLGIGKRDDVSNNEKGLVHLNFSIYLGWITVATIANVTAFLVKYGWNRFGFDEQFWTVIVIAVGIIITLGMIFIRSDIFHSIVVIWALAGILIKRLANPSTPAMLIIIITIAGIAILALSAIIQIIRYLRSGRGVYLRKTA